MNKPVEKEQFVKVIDASCTEENNVRTHEIIIHDKVIPITFKYGEPTILPFEQGVKFMIDGFTVSELEDGYTLNLPPVTKEAIRDYLEANQCIATFDELTIPALKVRAAQKNGGEIYLDATEEEKADIIAFIMDVVPVVEEEDLIDESDEDEIDTNETPTVDEDQKLLQARVDAVVDHFGGTDMIGIDVLEGEIIVHAVVGLAEGSDDPVQIVCGSLIDLEEFVAQGLSAKEVEDLRASEVVVDPAKEGDDKTVTMSEVEGSTDEALILANKYELNVLDVKGTGEDGNVLIGDVEKHIADNDLQPVEIIEKKSGFFNRK